MKGMAVRWAAVAAVACLLLAGCFGTGKGKGTDDSAGPQPPVDNGTVEAPTPPLSPAWPHFPSDGASEKTVLEIPSFDGHQIPLTVYRPLVANATQQVPVLLHSHGFTGSRATADDAFRDFVAAGFGVVSFDQRGHGDSRDDSEIHFMHPEGEVQDVIAVIDHVAAFDWVLLDAPGDPRLGGIGYSYGGAFQLMAAIFDPRLDALVPEITWNDIVESLAPNGAIKSGWVDLFYLAGNAQGSVVFSQDFHVGWAWAAASNEFPAGQAPGVPDLASRLLESSPVSYPGRLRVPTLLVQGMTDTLFPLNEAVANLRLLEAAGVPSALYTHLHGHVLNTAYLAPETPADVGLQGLPGGDPCGDLLDLQVAWHQRHLLGLNVTLGPRVCLALEDETAVAGDAFPLDGTTMEAFDLGGPTVVAQAPAGPQLELPLLTATEETVVAGIPRVSGTVASPAPDAIVYFSLKVAGRTGMEAIVDDQVMPYRVAGPSPYAYPFDLDLGGVGVRLQPGDQLLLAVSTVEPMYFANAERIPGAVVLDDLQVELPIVPPGTPAWAPAPA